MGIWDKIKNKNEYDDEDEAYNEPQEEQPSAKPASTPSYAPRTAGASALELKVVRPETYEVVGKIADHLLNRCTVVLNLEAANKETAKRLVDFLSGVAYSINGNIQRVATNTIVITPSNVGITGEGLETGEAKPAPKSEEADDFAF